MKKLNWLYAASLLFVTLVSSVFAQEGDEYQSPVIKSSLEPIAVEIVDEATGGCWTNIKEVKSYAEAQLEIAGWQLAAEDEKARSLFSIIVVAERLEDGRCAGRYDIFLRAFARWYGGEPVWVTLNSVGSYFVGFQNINQSMFDRMKEGAELIFKSILKE